MVSTLITPSTGSQPRVPKDTDIIFRPQGPGVSTWYRLGTDTVGRWLAGWLNTEAEPTVEELEIRVQTEAVWAPGGGGDLNFLRRASLEHPITHFSGHTTFIAGDPWRGCCGHERCPPGPPAANNSSLPFLGGLAPKQPPA